MSQQTKPLSETVQPTRNVRENHRATIKCPKCRHDKVACKSDDGRYVKDVFDPNSVIPWEGCVRCKRISRKKNNPSILQRCKPHTLYLDSCDQDVDEDALSSDVPIVEFSDESIISDTATLRNRRISLPNTPHPSWTHKRNSERNSTVLWSPSQWNLKGFSNKSVDDAVGEDIYSSRRTSQRKQILDETFPPIQSNLRQVRKRRASHSLRVDAFQMAETRASLSNRALGSHVEQPTNHLSTTSNTPRRRARSVNDRGPSRAKSTGKSAALHNRQPQSTWEEGEVDISLKRLTMSAQDKIGDIAATGAVHGYHMGAFDMWPRDQQDMAFIQDYDCNLSPQLYTGLLGNFQHNIAPPIFSAANYNYFDTSLVPQTTHTSNGLNPNWIPNPHDGNSNLQVAIINGSVGLVRAMVTNPHEPCNFAHHNTQGFAALLLAAKCRQTDIVRLLLEADKRQPYDKEYRIELALALHEALTNKDTKIVEMLLQHGADATANIYPSSMAAYVRVLDPDENHTTEMKELFKNNNFTGFNAGLGMGQSFIG